MASEAIGNTIGNGNVFPFPTDRKRKHTGGLYIDPVFPTRFPAPDREGFKRFPIRPRSDETPAAPVAEQVERRRRCASYFEE
jgi:hypothetical protein